MCKYVVLLDHDKSGIDAANNTLEKGLLSEANLKYTICNGSPESEFEDCLKSAVYNETILQNFGVNINCPEFHGSKKWSERMRATFLAQGSDWTNETKENVKITVAQAIPKEINDINDIVIHQKSGSFQDLFQLLKGC